MGKLQLKILLDVDGFDDQICVFAYIFFFLLKSFGNVDSLVSAEYLGCAEVPGSPVVSQAGVLSLLKDPWSSAQIAQAPRTQHDPRVFLLPTSRHLHINDRRPSLSD